MDRVVVTLREAIFSVTIASVLFLAGFLISTRIEHGVNQRNLRYRQAAKIATEDGFLIGARTDIGYAFVEGEFKAVDTVSHEKLGGQWLWIMADHQRYTRHTRTVTYTTTDGKGHVHTHTRVEHYWTWDTFKVEKSHSKKVSYMGVEFPYGKFDYSWVGNKYKTVDTGLNTRIEFTSMPAKFRASAFTKLEKGTVSDGTGLRPGVHIEKLYESCTKSYAVVVFWVLWILLMAAAVVGFVVLDNRWIEDKQDELQ
jgi:hypothetical protein